MHWRVIIVTANGRDKFMQVFYNCYKLSIDTCHPIHKNKQQLQYFHLIAIQHHLLKINTIYLKKIIRHTKQGVLYIDD